jgi:hypothetical protein
MRQELTVWQIKSHFSIVCRFYLFSLIINIKESSESEGERQVTCDICPQVIQNDNECGYMESQHDEQLKNAT